MNAPANDATVLIELDGLPSFRLKLHDRFDRFVSGDIRRDRVWERFETEVVLALLAPGGTFVDIGANLGWYSVVAGLKVGSGGRVIAFEPDPDNFSLLTTNAALNGLSNIEPVQMAVGNSTGEATLFLSDDNLGDHRLYAAEEPRNSVNIRTTTLDSYFGERPVKPDAIKMDTQGAEAHILAGMRSVLTQGHTGAQFPLIAEFWPFGLERAGTSAHTFAGDLESLRMSAWLVDEAASQLIPIGWQELRMRAEEDLRPESHSFVNILVMPNEQPLPLQMGERVAANPWSQK